MSKVAGVESFDDVAGLFARLGADDAQAGYQDFSSSYRPVTPKAATAAAVEPVAIEPVAAAAPAAAVMPTVVASSTPAAIMTDVDFDLAFERVRREAAERTATPLQQLFQRLADGHVEAVDGSPLSKLQLT